MSKKIKIVYVAGPYRARTRWETEENVHKAEELAIRVAKAGAYPICPHANTRPYFEDIQPAGFWLSGTLETLRRCDAIIFAPGWKRSEGSLGEYTEAQKLGLPTFLHMRELIEWLNNDNSAD